MFISAQLVSKQTTYEALKTLCRNHRERQRRSWSVQPPIL
jgi:hypothetical protein